MIYLDSASGRKVKKEVLEYFNEIESNYFSNANSLHSLGKKSLEMNEYFNKEILKLLELDSNEFEIIHTSSGTEANNLAIKGIANSYSGFGKHILVSPFEHSSTNATLGYLKDHGYEIEFLELDENGQIDLNILDNQIRKDTILVIINIVEGETGLIQFHYKEISKIVHNHHTNFFADVVQAVGKIKLDYSYFDLFSVSPHKFGGLTGTGMLIKRKDIILTPLIHGGKSLSIYRSGSIPTGLIATTYKSLEIAVNLLEKNYIYVKSLYDYLLESLKDNDKILVNSLSKDNPYILNLSIKGHRGSEIVNLLDEKEIYISQKAACNISNTPSKVIMALFHDKSRASESFRISLDEEKNPADLEYFLKILKGIC